MSVRQVRARCGRHPETLARGVDVVLFEIIDTMVDYYLQVADHAALTRRTNEIMRVLTLDAAVLMPLTLIAGIDGMNLPVWPPSDHPLSFWGVLVLMSLVASGMFVYFRRRKWLWTIRRVPGDIPGMLAPLNQQPAGGGREPKLHHFLLQHSSIINRRRYC